MSKDIEMFEISDNDKENVVGTEILEPNLPSNIDFQQKIEDHHEKSFINPQKKLPEMGKVLLIGDQMKAFRVKGKPTVIPKLVFVPNTIMCVPVLTHPVKLFGEQSTGFKKFWQSIIGHSKREMLVQDGIIYFLQRQKEGLCVRSYVQLVNLFKIFVDPEEETIRLVVRADEHLVNKDIQPDNFILATEMINHQLNKLGLTLSD